MTRKITTFITVYGLLLIPGFLTGQERGTVLPARQQTGPVWENDASESETVDLGGCIIRGLEHNFDVRVARNNQEISDNNVTRGNAGFLPEVTFSNRFGGTL
ncbi:MAG TPA: hypothetical protein PLX49_03720, partial [Prolixibacteraceae bacterium]|nr:hypothetical protein [Prolixibacteraceae bacterium]